MLCKSIVYSIRKSPKPRRKYKVTMLKIDIAEKNHIILIYYI